MFQKESSIERIVRENTPSFVIGTSSLVEHFHSYKKWSAIVQLKKGDGIRKYALVEGVAKLKTYRVAMADFVLNDDFQMKLLENSIYGAENGLPYQNPFIRKHGWYIEVFGDYWHGESIVPVSPEEHEREVKSAYEKNGNHVLILWEKDIVYHWNEYCKPKIDEYIRDFCSCHKVSTDRHSFSELSCRSGLSDLSLSCLNEKGYYAGLGQEERKKVVDELVAAYSSMPPCFNKNEIDSDWREWKQKCESNSIRQGSSTGNTLLNFFIRSRFDARVRKSRTMNEIWKDESVMRNCINWQLDNENPPHHSNRFFAAMQYVTRFRCVSNLNQSYVYLRCRKYAKKGGLFFDPCAGWGGRLLGAYALGMKYVAIDANKKLVDELNELAKYMGYDAEIYYGDSSNQECVEKILNGRKIDMAFTCPPYWNEEHYSDDELQSDVRFESSSEWHSGFLCRMIENVNSHMSNDGHFILSFDEKVDLRMLRGFRVTKMNFCGFNKRREDDYYLIGRDNCKENDEYVRCEIYGKCMSHLTNHIVREHKMTLKEYCAKFPGCRVISEISSLNRSNANRIKFGEKKRKYGKRFVYLLPDGTYASKSDKYKRAWGREDILPEHVIDATTIDYVPDYAKRTELGSEGEDYVVCAICGAKKGSLTQHLRRKHGMTISEYDGLYHLPVYSRRSAEAFHQCALKKWHTQFANGTSKHSVPKSKSEHPKNRRRDDITAEQIAEMLSRGCDMAAMCSELKCTDTTLRKMMSKLGVDYPGRTVIAIRKAVADGAKRNLEEDSLETVEALLKEFGREQTWRIYGVKRAVFDTWMNGLKKQASVT